MDRNALLAVALSLVVYTAWATYQAQRSAEYAESQPEAAAQMDPSEASPGSAPETAPESAGRGAGELAAPGRLEERAPEGDPGGAAGQEIAEWEKEIVLSGIRAVVTNQGAAIRQLTLLDYEERLDGDRFPVELVGRTATGGPALVTPLRELGLGDLSRARFRVEGESDTSVHFVLERDGVIVRKTIGFDPEGYGLRLVMAVENRSERVLSPNFEVVWPVRARDRGEFSTPSLVALEDGGIERETISGAGFFGPGGLDEPVLVRGDVEWAGIDDKYFLRALLPDRPRSARVVFDPVEAGRSARLRVGFETVEIPPSRRVEHEFQGYVGPKRPADLDVVSVSLERSINRGWSWISPLTAFFEWLLAACYQVVPNYGLAIIILTVMVRLVTAPIMGRQMKSMERMRAVQPKLKELQEKHKDDRQAQSQAMMELYRKEGVNPLGGCLPMLLQFPVFIGLFYALQSSFELRHAGFALWIDDLSAPESLFVLPGLDLEVRLLPIIMGASMVLQQKLTPTTIDPAQARMMMVLMPVMFTVLFYGFPSGLVLYWMISNLLGIGHQLWVGRRMQKT